VPERTPGNESEPHVKSRAGRHCFSAAAHLTSVRSGAEAVKLTGNAQLFNVRNADYTSKWIRGCYGIYGE